MFCGLRSRWTMPASCAAAHRRADRQQMSASSLGARARPVALQRSRQVLAAQQLHHQVRDAAVGADVGDVDDVRVAHRATRRASRRKRAARAGHRGDQPGDSVLIATALAESGVRRLVDRAHAARAQQPHDLCTCRARSRARASVLRSRLPCSPDSPSLTTLSSPSGRQQAFPEVCDRLDRETRSVGERRCRL